MTIGGFLIISALSASIVTSNFTIPTNSKGHPKPTPTPTLTPTVQITPTPTIAITPTITIFPTPTSTPSATPQPTPTPTGTVSSSSMCINYGHQASTYDLTQAGKDMDILNNAGIKCIRLAYIGWNNSQSEALAVFIKGRGFRVTIGGDWGTIDPSQFGSYDSQVLQEAKWAESNHIDQFSLGNEQEYRLSGMSIAAWVSHVQGLATQVKAVYHGVVSYETSSDFISNWTSRGDIDLLGWNSYCGYDCNLSRLQTAITNLGKDHVYVSEANADSGSYSSDSDHATEVQNDAIKLESLGIPIYYCTFCYL